MLVCLGVHGLAAQAVPPRKLAAALARVYGATATADTLVVGPDTLFRVGRADSLLGFAVVRHVMGKDQPITYLVATDAELRLRDVDILVYRESYGGEVAYESWRRQFRGHGPGDSLRVGREIRGISGATISVHAVTLGVQLALRGLARHREAGQL